MVIETEKKNMTTLANEALAPTEVAKPKAKANSSLAHRLYTGQLGIDFIGRKKLWYLISGVVILLCLIGIFARGLNFGIEFKGGSQFQAQTPVTANTVQDVRKAVLDLGLPEMDSVVVTTLGSDRVQVQTRSLTTPEVTEVRTAIAKQAGVESDTVAYSLIGASWGDQITRQSLIALGVFLVLVALMIGVYFRNWKMSLAAIIALIHDLIVTVGVYALVGFSFTPASVIGLLTILGYSLYDTVVVFDKVRENTEGILTKSFSYDTAANRAVNQVLIRSINTTVIGILPVLAILLTGVFVLRGGPLQDLGLALFVGMIAGTYSSIFIATPLLCQLKGVEPELVAHNKTLAKRAQRKQEHHLQAEVVDVEKPQQVNSSQATLTAENSAKRNQPARPTRRSRKKK